MLNKSLMEEIDVLVVGRSCLDYISLVETFPEENHKVPLTHRIVEGGGQGGTSACCIARLGGKVAYVAKLGADEEGQFCLKRLADFGVSTEFIEIVTDGKTPVAFVFVTKSNGNRTIIYESSTLPKIKIGSNTRKLASQANVILLDPEVTYLGKDFQSLTDDNSKIVYDCERWRDGIQDMMDAADFFIPSSDFLVSKELKFDDAPLPNKIFKLKEQVNGELIVTHGRDGAYYISNHTLHHVSAPEIQMKDTIGAGDNFHAAFALAISKGFDLHRAVKFSVAVASLSCREYGGRNGIPQLKEAIQVADNLAVRILASDPSYV
jgi:sugar/nucleoside kinase (ribokinase family)